MLVSSVIKSKSTLLCRLSSDQPTPRLDLESLQKKLKRDQLLRGWGCTPRGRDPISVVKGHLPALVRLLRLRKVSVSTPDSRFESAEVPCYQIRLDFLILSLEYVQLDLAQCGVPIDLQQVLKSRVDSFSRAGLWNIQYSEPAQFQSRAPTSIAMGYMKEEVEIRCRVRDRLRRSLGISISMCHGNSLFARPRLPYFRCIAW